MLVFLALFDILRVDLNIKCNVSLEFITCIAKKNLCTVRMFAHV